MAIVENQNEVARRFGFVSFLLWIGGLGVVFVTVQDHQWNWLRILWIVISIGLAAFFTRTWWRLKKGLDL